MPSSLVAAALRQLSEIERIEDLAKVAERPERPDLSFKEFIKKYYPRFRWYPHAEKLVDVLQRVADGELKRVMIAMPPRHGKTQTATKLFPAYFLYRYPEKFVSINSYAADLANSMSRAVREFHKAAGGINKPDADTITHWETIYGGGCFVAGVGGPITGKGWHLGIVDDPLKNWEEAQSKTIRDKQKDWYDSTFATREEPWTETDPTSPIIIIQTRWHPDDLSGWLLSRESSDDESPECWHIVNMEAIKEEFDPVIPSTCTLEPDWRQPGEALCPERRPLDRLLRIRAKSLSIFTALYQQRPTPAGGGIIQLRWFNRYDTLPARPEKVVVSVDTAQTAKETSAYWAIGVYLIYRGEYFIAEVYRRQMVFPVGQRAVISICEKYRDLGYIPDEVLIENKSNGIDLINNLKSNPDFPWPLIPIDPEADKITRMESQAGAVEAGKCFLPSSAGWLPDFELEVEQFPLGFKDQIDQFSQFLKRMKLGETRHWASLYQTNQVPQVDEYGELDVDLLFRR